MAVVSVLVACAPAAEVTLASDDRVTTGTFDKNDVVSDEALLDKNALTSTQIQAFLDKTPWNTKSVLAGYTEGGQSAAQIITTVSQKYGVNPIALLVRVQMEQSLLYKATAPDSTIKIAFGCGCPHSSICSAKYEGFANQADCAAGTLSRSIVAATTSTGTASGWKKGTIKTTVDKVSVNPANAATAALYTYTPYVGEAGGGDKGVGGASLHKQVWDKVTTNLGYTPTSRTGSSTTAAATTAAADAGADASTGDTDPTDTDPTDTDPTDTDPTTATPDAGTGASTTTSKPSASASAADDASLLQEGNAPPTSNNVPLPQSSGSHKSSSSSSSSSSATTTGSSASSDDGDSSSSNSGSSDDESTTPKTVASSGCSSTGHAGGGSGLFAGISVALVGLLARRRRSA